MTLQGRASENGFGHSWAPEYPPADALIAATSDIALAVDQRGIVRDVRYIGSDESLALAEQWRGRALIDTVTIEARPKVEEMLREVAAHGISRQRQVNHPSTSGPDLPIAYTLVRLGKDGSAVALGRDLRAISALQQRLVEAQQALERDYWQMRHVETRYRLLFQLSSEAVVVAEVGSLKVVDANPAAGRVFGVGSRLTGWSLESVLDGPSQAALEEHLAVTRSQGSAKEFPVRLKDGSTGLMLRAVLMPQDNASRYLIQVVSGVGGTQNRNPRADEVIAVLEAQPDGFVLVNDAGQIEFANRAFLDLVQLAAEEQVRNRPLAQWVGRPGADIEGLLGVLRSNSQVRLFATAVRGSLGAATEVEVSGVRVAVGRGDVLGLVIRHVGRRLAAGPQGARDLTLAVEQLTSLVGRVSLRDLVRDTTTLVERHFIEAALELSEQNRTSAAEILGVSRQSLYVKLRRLGAEAAGPVGMSASARSARAAARVKPKKRPKRK